MHYIREAAEMSNGTKMQFDSRKFVEDSEIIYEFERGRSKQSLAELVKRRNSVKDREALYIVETALLKLFKEA